MFSILNILWQNLSPRIQSKSFPAARLDFFFVSKHFCDKIRKTEIKASVKSDHKISTIAIHVVQVPRRPGFWKLDAALCYGRNMYILSNVA